MEDREESVQHLLLYHISVNITIFRIFNISPFITDKEYTNKTNGLVTMP